ncbi:helix-turn-helix transcriptional regulator [Yoonia sp. BS5-3]|uniref:Helix-turn-helix transcriptional regulator n=1 Tax=Yoonia phaeophyticola TaxID=3137369 RepID=A0ABZ2V979_9RHOB
MRRPTSQKQISLVFLGCLTAFQILCAGFFVAEFLTEVLGLRHWALPFVWREILQILASLGLVIGSVTAILLLRQMRRRMNDVDRQLRAASGAFGDVMTEFFDEWSLSPSERDVAMFALRGYSNSEIADLRGKSEATVKTQINAVFRKADVTSRAQLMGLFVDAIMSEAPQKTAPNAVPAAA